MPSHASLFIAHNRVDAGEMTTAHMKRHWAAPGSSLYVPDRKVVLNASRFKQNDMSNQPADSPPTYAFISYVREDRARVDRLQVSLE
jgi:hypothetical protein